VNKWDLNPAMAKRIEGSAASRGAATVGEVRYDRAVTAAQVMGKSVVEYGDGGVVVDIGRVWEGVCRWIRGCSTARSS